MVRISLDMCIADMICPADIFSPDAKNRLLLKKGVPLSENAKRLLAQNKVEFIDFPLPFEKRDAVPFTFSNETESSLFRLARDSFRAYKNDAIADPLELRKEAYDILAQAASEFEKLYVKEHPVTDAEPKRELRSIIHLRTVGALQDYLFEHAKNVSLISLALGFDYFSDSKQRLSDLHKVSVAGLFADIGMMKIPSRILTQETELSEKDWEIVRKHPETSAQFVESLFRQKNFITAKIVLQHHERMDGSGYPAGITGHTMEPYASVLAVADSYNSMISKRYFRPVYEPLEALASINQAAGKLYDKKAAECLNFRIAPYPIGTVAHFLKEQLIQVVELTNIPSDIGSIKIPVNSKGEGFYNIPKTIRKFVLEQSQPPDNAVSIEGQGDKIGKPLDAFDLLSAYGYVAKS
ncbi:MAG: HD domain-containing phosphohydrolase [Candidatus Omnitrophota bacterium]